jgi:hypothetical protein
MQATQHEAPGGNQQGYPQTWIHRDSFTSTTFKFALSHRDTVTVTVSRPQPATSLNNQIRIDLK